MWFSWEHRRIWVDHTPLGSHQKGFACPTDPLPIAKKAPAAPHRKATQRRDYLAAAVANRQELPVGKPASSSPITSTTSCHFDVSFSKFARPATISSRSAVVTAPQNLTGFGTTRYFSTFPRNSSTCVADSAKVAP